MTYKRKIASLVLVGVVTFTGVHVAMAAAVDYYSFTGLYNGVVEITDDPFTVTNSNNVVTIDGWQDTGGTPVADVTYEVVRDVWYGWEKWSVPKKITGNYKATGGPWYTHTFQGVPKNPDYHIRMTFHQGYPANGAGNVYQ